MTRVLVTGATGFVGRSTCRALAARGCVVRAATRAALPAALPGVHEVHVVGDITAPVDWAPALDGVDVVVHLAARVHVMRDRADDLDAVYRRANVDASVRLARAAAAAGARRLVYVSSVKAAGERTSGTPLREDDPTAPEDAYGRSKRDAEEALRALGRETGLEIVVVRPPLVYGPGVGGNFRRLLTVVRLAARVPLPLGAARAPRSLVYVENLADALATVALHPDAASGTFYVRDGLDLSTSSLIRRLGAAVGVRPRLLPVSAAAMRLLATALGRRGEVERLFSGLQVDDRRLRERLGWHPPVTVDDALTTTARALAGTAKTLRRAGDA